jgi:acyl carrier protein
MKNTIIKKVRSYILEKFFFGGPMCEYMNSESLLAKGIVDSTGILELINFIEDEFEIRVEDEEMLPDNLDSMDNIAAFVVRKQSSRVRLA